MNNGNMNSTTIGQKIRQLRLKERKNQGYCAKILGLSTPAYSKIEAGITDINIARLVQISKLFGVRPASFFESDDIAVSELTRQKDLVNELQAKLISCLEGKMCCKEQ